MKTMHSKIICLFIFTLFALLATAFTCEAQRPTVTRPKIKFKRPSKVTSAGKSRFKRKVNTYKLSFTLEECDSTLLENHLEKYLEGQLSNKQFVEGKSLSFPLEFANQDSVSIVLEKIGVLSFIINQNAKVRACRYETNASPPLVIPTDSKKTVDLKLEWEDWPLEDEELFDPYKSSTFLFIPYLVLEDGKARYDYSSASAMDANKLSKYVQGVAMPRDSTLKYLYPILQAFSEQQEIDEAKKEAIFQKLLNYPNDAVRNMALKVTGVKP